MIILLLVIATFVFSGAMIFGRASLTRTVTLIVSFLVIAGGLIGLAGNDQAHWGMQQVTTTTTHNLDPVRSPQAALLVKRLGTGSEKVVVYRVANAAKTSHTVAATNTTTRLTTGTTAQVKIATTRWQYRNHFTKVLFKLGTGKAQIAHRHYVFTVPSDWKTITTKAAH